MPAIAAGICVAEGGGYGEQDEEEDDELKSEYADKPPQLTSTDRTARISP